MIVSLNHISRGDLADYLRIDNYLGDLVKARALQYAFSTSMVDLLVERPQGLPESLLQSTLTADLAGLHLLLQILTDAHVVQNVPAGNGITSDVGGHAFDAPCRWQLTESFRQALAYRDLLEAKLEFTLLAAADYLENLPQLARSESEYLERSRIMELFDYSRCLQADDESLAAAWRWMRFTTALTRYEAPACLAVHSMAPYRQVVDVGGNSGEFARQMCEANSQLQATVLDLPAVCEVGRRYLNGLNAGDRVQFEPGSALQEAWPGRPDLITFKSMLHDWPDEGVAILLEHASRHVKPGGTILIFERDRFDKRRGPVRFSDLPMLVFFRSLRGPERYREILERNGLSVEVQQVELEMPFFVLAARRPW